jgi:galactokinase
LKLYEIAVKLKSRFGIDLQLKANYLFRMEFPDLATAKEKITDLFFDEKEIAADDVCVIASPYRICPLGAHIDHQGGPVLGMTINAYTLLAFAPTDDGTVRLKSKNYPGKVGFELDRIPETTGSFWGVYARAADSVAVLSALLNMTVQRLQPVISRKLTASCTRRSLTRRWSI